MQQVRDAVTKSGDRGAADPAHHRGNCRILTSFHRQQVEQAREVRCATVSPARSAGARIAARRAYGPHPRWYRQRSVARRVYHGGQHALFGAEVPVNRAGASPHVADVADRGRRKALWSPSGVRSRIDSRTSPAAASGGNAHGVPSCAGLSRLVESRPHPGASLCIERYVSAPHANHKGWSGPC